MADDNKIQLDVEISESSVEGSFSQVDKRAEKSAKTSAAVFGEAFQRQEQELKASIDRLVGETRKATEKSAKESASVFQEAFQRQNEIYKASVKQNLDNAIKALTGGNAIKKSAQESASVFEEAFQKGLLGGGGFTNFFKGLLPESLKNAFQPRSLTDIAAGFFLIKQAAGIAQAAIKETIDFILEGEAKIKLEQRFKALAEQAGVAADVLRNDLGDAAKGLIDDDRLLQLASESFVNLGNNAKRLPEILELARKTYKVFGGDIVANTEAISQAIFTGQTRQIKQLGLLIDTEKVYRDYAKNIGTVVPLLTEQQRQTALLNAVLAQGETRFKNISGESDSAKDAFTRLSVQVKEIGDSLRLLANSTFGKSLASGAEAVASSLKELNKGFEFVNKAPESVEKLSFQVNFLEKSIKGAQDQLSKFNAVEEFVLGNSFRKNIEENSKALDELKKKLADTSAPKPPTPTGDTGGGGSPTGGLSEEYVRRQTDLNNKVLELNQQRAASDLALAQQAFQLDQTRQNFEMVAYQTRLQEAEKYQTQKAALEKFYLDNGVVDETLRQQGREALESAHLNRLLLYNQQYEEQKKMLFDASNAQTVKVGEAFREVAAGMQQAAFELSTKAAKNFKAFGQAMLNSVGSAAGNAFAAFGQAVATGQNALQAFGKALLQSLGNAAIQMGGVFILQGIAYTYAGLANGPPLIAAGAALAVAGGILAASQGAGPTGASAGGGSSGYSSGGFDSSSPVTAPTKPEDTKPEVPKTAINLTINGNVLDRRETGLEIASILEEQFAEQGLTIRGVG